jgi:hypothetical protein
MIGGDVDRFAAKKARPDRHDPASLFHWTGEK